ncbi:MAG: hypothetical protein MUF00_01755 [Gemmatimonadaceae bacterium]|jgi:hypothetical protein|nr:hypothetical protein [Gemmatimonadaceae bacterium]
MTDSVKGMIVYRPAWRNEATGAVTLEEARIVRRELSGRHYVLAFKGKTDGRWREKRGWVFTDLYASPEHYEAHVKAREAASRVRRLERAAADAAVVWWKAREAKGHAVGVTRVAAAAKRLAAAQTKLAKLEAARDKLAGPLAG